MPESVNFILSAMAEHGHEAYAVGGCVRDALLGKPPRNWTICTTARPEDIRDCFVGVDVGLIDGTNALHLDGMRYEVISFCMDYTCGRYPKKAANTALKAYLGHMEFTVDALAYSPWTGVVDFFHGREDLRRGILRCLGDPDTKFGEDALRILRALRLASSYRFELDTETAKSVHKNKKLLSEVSGERVRDEFCQLLMGTAVMRVCREYRDVLAVLIREITPCFDFQQNSPYHIHDVWEHTLYALDESAEELPIRLAVFFHDIGKPQCYFEDERGGHFHGHGRVSAEMGRVIMSRLQFDNECIQTVSNLVEYHDRFIEVSEEAVRRLLKKLGPVQFDQLLKVRSADILAQSPDYATQRLDKIANLKTIASRVLSQNNCLSIEDLAVSGGAPFSAGYLEGAEIGEY